MATFPGLDLLHNFSGIFTLLFAYAVIYGILSVTNIFKEKSKVLNPLIAISGSLILLLSDRFVGVVESTAPWVVVIAFMLFFIMLLLKFLGVGDDNITKFFTTGKQRQTVIYIIIITVVLLMLYGIGQEFGQDIGPYLGNSSSESTSTTEVSVGDISGSVPNTATDDFQQNFGATIFHPKVLGLIAILLIASFAIRYMSFEDIV